MEGKAQGKDHRLALRCDFMPAICVFINCGLMGGDQWPRVGDGEEGKAEEKGPILSAEMCSREIMVGDGNDAMWKND